MAKGDGVTSFSVDFMSDLHADLHDSPLDYAALKKNDIAVVAGDVASDPATCLAELKKIAAVYETVLFVDGNHEFRSGKKGFRYNFDFAAVEETLREGIEQMPNVVYLRDKPFVKDGVAIIGRNGHWDYRILKGYPWRQAVREGLGLLGADFNKAASFSKMARRDYYALRDHILQFNGDPSIHTIVVVTHTVPRAELIDFKADSRKAKHAQKGSWLMRNLLRHDMGKKVKFWLFGHQHAAKTQQIDGVLYHENPRGHDVQAARTYRPSVLKFGT